MKHLSQLNRENKLILSYCYWDLIDNIVERSYFTSAFIGHIETNDVLLSFQDNIDSIKKENLLHVSLDGPSMNLNLLNCSMNLEKKTHYRS